MSLSAKVRDRQEALLMDRAYLTEACLMQLKIKKGGQYSGASNSLSRAASLA